MPKGEACFFEVKVMPKASVLGQIPYKLKLSIIKIIYNESKLILNNWNLETD